MSSIIEANAYAQHFQNSDITLGNATAKFRELAFIFAIMIVAAVAGIVFTIPSLTIIAGLVIAATAIDTAYTAIRRNS